MSRVHLLDGENVMLYSATANCIRALLFSSPKKVLFFITRWFYKADDNFGRLKVNRGNKTKFGLLHNDDSILPCYRYGKFCLPISIFKIVLIFPGSIDCVPVTS